MGSLDFVKLGREEILHVLYRLGFVVERVSCGYFTKRDGVEDSGNRDFWSTGDEKLERSRSLPSSG